MKLNGTYTLPPEEEEPLRRTSLKGVGAVVLILTIILFAAGLTGPYLSNAVSFLRDVVGAIGLLITIQSYSRAVANQRLALARKYRSKGKPELVLAALQPYLRPSIFLSKSHFDPTGEAHYLLAWAAKQKGEEEALGYARAFLTRFRRTEWTRKALKL